MPPGLAYMFTCPSEGACALSNRIRNDYDMVDICLWCRLDVELTWFLGSFHFFDLGFLLKKGLKGHFWIERTRLSSITFWFFDLL